MAAHSDGDPHHGSYLDVDTHKDMLRDVVRTSAYADAIRDVVKPGQRVIDFGSGTGVLAIFAARSGASVEAIERTRMVEHAREIARRSGCPTIRFHHGDHESFQTDAKVDVIVSEWMGHAVFYESMLEPLIALRQRWLLPGGVMLPSRIAVSCALVTDEALFEELSFLEHEPYGIDFGPIADLPLRQAHLVTLDESQVTSRECELAVLDMASIESSPRQMSARLELAEPATAYGLLLWFTAELAPGVALGTGPHHPPTHWRQLFLPFPQPRDVSPAHPLLITVRPPYDVEEGAQTWAWSVDDGRSVLHVDEHDSFARAGRL
jgi:SAM-dependent methyltransferase